MSEAKLVTVTDDPRCVVEGPQVQGCAEQLAYRFVFPTGDAPTDVVFVLWDMTTGEPQDVSTAHLSGAAETVGNVVTSPLTHDLAHQHAYRLDCLAWVRGNRLGPFVPILARQ